MSLRPMLGDIELQQVQFIDSDQDQVLARHDVPALEGDFWQGLGRRAAGFSLAGVLSGAEAGEGLSSLREKFRAAEPVSFVADIAEANRVDQVLIEEMEVREIAGRPLRFEYAFRLREYLPPPPVPEVPPPIIPPELPLDQATLIVEVVVEGEPEFDHSATVVTVAGTRGDGSSLSRTLTNRQNNVWTEQDMPPGNYTCRATVERPEPLTGSAQAVVRAGETTRVVITLRSGAVIAKAFVVHFWFDKAFIEPCQRIMLRRVADHAAHHPDEKIVIVGHTDLVGSDEYNQSLSERRGRAVHAWLTAGRDRAASIAEWEELRRTRPVGQLPSLHDTWATREYQFILSDLEYYKGSIDENHGPLTSAAVRSFQLDKGLPQTGSVDDATWSALIAAYLDQDRLVIPESQFLPNAKNGCRNGVVKWLGCGEKDPVRNTQDAWRPNRRTEMLFVRASEFPCAVAKPATWDLPAAGGDWCIGPGDPNKRCCFVARGSEQPGKWLVVPAESGQVTVSGSVTRPDGTPVANEPYALMAPDGEYLHTDAGGRPDLGERPSGPQRGRPIPNRTAADGSFSYPDPRPPGTYILHLLELQAPAVARLADAPPQTARNNFVCRRLEASPPARNVPVVIEPAPAPPVTVNPTLTLSRTVVVVKKSYTSPARVQVTLGTSAPFNRTGTLTRSSNSVRFFTAASGGAEITFDGTDNVFTGAQLTAGVHLFAEGASASAAMDDFQLTLTLAAGSTPTGPPAVATMTAVALTLDIAGPRPAPGTPPPPLPQPPDPPPAAGATDKWFGGRLLNAQDPDNRQERALVIVRPVQPAAFTGTLTLRNVVVAGNTITGADTKLQLFDNERPTAGEAAKNNPHEFAANTIPAAGLELFAQGRTSSANLRDTGLQLGIKDVEADGDRVAATVGVTAQIAMPSTVVLVKKPHTSPARRPVTLRTNVAFARTGTLTRSSNAIRFFTAASGGSEITFNGADNVFTGAQLTAGVQVFAEGATASAAMDDFQLTLTLAAGNAPPAGLPTTAHMTAVELTLDVFSTRTSAAADPPVMTAVQKINPGRFVQVRDPGFSHERAMLIVRPPQPAGFTGTLVLTTLDTPNPRVRLFSTEAPAAADAETATPHPIPAGTIPPAGARLFVEARTFSAAARDTGFRLGIQGGEADGDRVNMTAVQIEMVTTPTAAAAAATFVRMGLWDNAFNAAGVLFNQLAEADNFAGADSRKVHIRVRDAAARTTGSVQADWRTRDQANNDLDAPVNRDITLVEVAASQGTFISRGLLLVSDNDDRDQTTHSGLAAPLPDAGLLRARGQRNHRTRRGSLLGTSLVEYRPAAGIVLPLRLPVFRRNPEERRRMPLQIFVLRVAAAGAGVIPTAAGSNLWNRDLRVIRESYERIGITVETFVAPGTPAANIVTVGGDSVVLIDPPAGVNPLNVAFAPVNDESTIGAAFPAAANTLRIFYTGGLASGNRGESWPDANFAATPQVGASFINGATYGPYTVAHEIGHVLTNKNATVNTGHYRQPAAPAGNRLQNNQNLMRNGTSAAEGVDQSKRLWDNNDADGVNQYTSIRGSRFTRNF